MARKKRTAACTPKNSEAVRVLDSLVKIHSLRTRAIVQISEWALEGKIKVLPSIPHLMFASDSPPAIHLDWLLGEESWSMDPLTKLAGPHGFTFYKILIARKGRKKRCGS
jgi:hypothetical protein